MPKQHFQATRIYAVEDVLTGGTRMEWADAHALVERVCADHDVPAPVLIQGDSLSVDEVVTLPPEPSILTVLHALAHLLTDPVFPPHGSEFAGRWVELAHSYSDAGDALDAELGRSRVHRTAGERVEKVRRGAVYLANNRRGQLVELVLDEPPERVAGSIECCGHHSLTVGGCEFPLSRARYIYRMEMV